MSLHLFEFEDQDWFPQVLRDYQTAFLAALARYGGLYQSVPPTIPAVARIADLASGAGDPAVLCTAALRKEGTVLELTDKFPHLDAPLRYGDKQGLSYRSEALDILTDGWPQADCYVMFNAFHHFSPPERKHILHKLSKSGAELCVYEPLQRDVLTALKVLLATLLGPFLLVPFIRPFSWRRLFFTYILPIGVFVTFWDGMVSVLRALSYRDIRALALQSSELGISMSHSTLQEPFARITYLRFSCTS